MKNRNAIISKVNQLLSKRFDNPKRSNALPNPLDLLIATILSQNTNDNNSYKAFQNLKHRYKSWDELIDEKKSNDRKRDSCCGISKAEIRSNQKSAK